MSKVSGMSGTSWHVEALSMKESDKRRHRSNCIYYDKTDSYCHNHFQRCMGSAHCKQFKDKNDVKEKQIEFASEELHKENSKKVAYKSTKKVLDFSKYGVRVFHKKWKNGTVIDGDGKYIVVMFDKNPNEPKTLDVTMCIENNLLTIV